MRKLILIVVALLLATSTADARRRRGKRARAKLNMPPGWTWPPSQHMRDEGRACLRRLDELGLKWKKAPSTRKVTTPIFVPSMEIAGVQLTSMWKKGPFVMDCQLALALADGGAGALRSAGVSELRFSSIHAYRNVAGTRTLSRHAIGVAIDVFQIVTDDGEVHVVERDYPDVVLLSVEKWVNDSGAFRYLLTPGNDPRRHDDHFHFEARSAEERRKVTASSTP
jgi:hypothetical protein